MEFGVTVASQGRWEILTVTGEIDMATAPRFRQRLLSAIGGGAQNVVLDLSGVDFIDSTGLGVLMGGAKRVRSAGGDIRMVVAGSRLAELVELTRLDRVLDVHDSVASATADPTDPATADPDTAAATDAAANPTNADPDAEGTPS